MRQNKRGRDRLRNGFGPRTGLTLSYTQRHNERSRQSDDPRGEVVAEMKKLGIDAGWAAVTKNGLGWCRGVVLLLRRLKRRQRNVAWVGRSFVASPQRVNFAPIRREREDLENMSAPAWTRLLKSYKASASGR